MPSAPATPLRAPSRQSVTLMARVPKDLADQVGTYAHTHALDISTLVRAGLTWVLTQPPASMLPPAPAPAPAPEAAPPQLPARLLRVLEAHPAGIDVSMLTAQVNTGKLPKGHRASRAQVGQCLRHLYRAGHADRLAYGLYTARQQALDAAPPS